MTETEVLHIPPEIWHHILSFNSLPYGRGICAMITSIENDLIPVRIQYMYERYKGDIYLAIISNDWDACLLMCHYIDNFFKSDLMMSIYHCLRKHIYSVARCLHNSFWSATNNDMYEMILSRLAQAADIDGIGWLIDRKVITHRSGLAAIADNCKIEQFERYLIDRRMEFSFTDIIYTFADRGRIDVVICLLKHARMTSRPSTYHVHERVCPYRYDSDEATCYNLISEYARGTSYIYDSMFKI